MLKELINLANELDKKGLRKEADYLDSLLRKTAGRDEWLQHEDHPQTLELPGGEAAELEEDYQKGLVSARKVAEMIVGGTPIIGEDAESSIDELSDLLNTGEHTSTVEAILDYFDSMAPGNAPGWTGGPDL